MDVDVDRAGQEVQARDVDHLARGGHRLGRADRDDVIALDRDVGAIARRTAHDRAAGEDEIDRAAHSAAHPPSTARSTPLICRARSEARKRVASATSSAVLMRASA